MDITYKIISRHTDARTGSGKFLHRSSETFVVSTDNHEAAPTDRRTRFEGVQTSLEGVNVTWMEL